MRAAKGFLTVVGALYLLLAFWCTAQPARTANALGFTLTSGSGQSEYLVVYGGLELALAIVFWSPLWCADRTPFVLWACCVTHACAALFRAVSLVVYDVQPTTHVLAVVELAILIVGFVLMRRLRSTTG